MTDRERLTALLMAGAGDFIKKNGALNCTKLADYLLEHGVIVTEEAEKALDVSEVVRCKDCKNYELMKSNGKHFCNEFGGFVTEEDFCSRSERKER